ncbi:MAG: MarR family winged helix-turn-helix transcriptional regulator [Vulcanimicrobiaceae bacterium]
MQTMQTRTRRAKPSGDGAFERHRDTNLRRLLVAATRALNRHITQELNRQGYRDTRPGHAALLANLDLAGNSVTEVAERAQISKQAMARLAVELEDMGIISRRVDGSDKRALTLSFTKRGRDLIKSTVSIVDEIERELSQAIGDRSMTTLKRSLVTVAKLDR